MKDPDLKNAADAAPDPERALKNLSAFLEANPGYNDLLRENLRPVCHLFSISQFLANFSSTDPDALFQAVSLMEVPLTEEDLSASLSGWIESSGTTLWEKALSSVRIFKKRELLRITLRDILAKADTVESMHELSILADVIVSASLRLAEARMREIYGEPSDDAFSVIAVGKLGGHELNFSSDIDLLYVYKTEVGETSGVMTPGGVRKNRITNHEYYCRLGEQLNRFLSMNTEDGFAYRVDLRLRPEGQRGSLAQSLFAYEIYYESWGQEWERAALIRARPVAGDPLFGKSFLEMARPFVYRKYLDFSTIDEIRKMKTKINEAFRKDDIKRGYGGIREIEFFAQTLQLIYGGREPLLRERGVLTVLHRLLQKNLIGHEDYSLLNDNYLFLRKLEHRLQQLNDLQTHSLPAQQSELLSLSRKMGFASTHSFLSDLEQRRRTVRKRYDSLFTEEAGDDQPGASLIFTEELSAEELQDLLARYPVRDRAKTIRSIQMIRENTLTFQTLRGRRLLRNVLPLFLDSALRSSNPDAVITNLESLTPHLASEESYLEILAENKSLVPTITKIFSRSEYLSRIVMKRAEYVALLGQDLYRRKSLVTVREELRGIISSGMSLSDSIRMVRQMEEIRLGALFLEGALSVSAVVKGLSRCAGAILSVCTDEISARGLLVIGMGKVGGREITFDSDLDLVFSCGQETADTAVKGAERLIRVLTSYTKDGVAYRVDTRLRPDGTKGPLVSPIDALRSYYSVAAHFWEFQALLKARPLAGDRSAGKAFSELRREILSGKGKDVSPDDIRAMRERIEREISKEKAGYDLKLGPGGIEELEFTIQYLQLRHCAEYPGILAQGTLDAVRRLRNTGLIGRSEAEMLSGTYLFYRTLETAMRLQGLPVLRKADAAVADAAHCAGFKSTADLFQALDDARNQIRKFFETTVH